MKAILHDYPKKTEVEVVFTPAMEAYAKQLNAWPDVLLYNGECFTLEDWDGNETAEYAKTSFIVAEVPK